MKKINWLLVIGMIIGTLYYVFFQYNSDRVLTYLAIIPVLMIPLLLRKTIFKLNDKELCYYYIFIFLADFLGCVVNLYNITEWYDIFVHFCSGIFTFLVGLFIFDRVMTDKSNLIFKMFFSFLVVMAVAGLWELFEFGVDNLLGMNLQHNSDSGVHDTMIDMLMAFGGGLISVVGYYLFIGKRSVKNDSN